MSRLTRWQFPALQGHVETAHAEGQEVRLRWVQGRRSCAVVVLGCRASGFLAAVPASFLAEESLEQARADGFTGALGPSYHAEARLAGRGVENDEGAVAECLLIDLDATVAREMATYAAGAYRGFVGFGPDGRAEWPLREDLEEAANTFLGSVEALRDGPRIGDYVGEADAEAGDEMETAGSMADGATPRAGAGEPPPASQRLPVAAAPSAAVPPLVSARPPRLVPPGARLPQARGRVPAENRVLASEVDDLRRELRALRAQHALGEGEGAEKPGLEPETAAVAAGGADPQFFSEGRRLGLSGDELQRLLGLAGSPPARLADPSGLAPADLRRATSAAPSPPLAASSSSAAPAAPPAAPGTDPLLQMLVAQNEMLMKLLTSRQEAGSPTAAAGSLEDLLSGGGGGLLDDSKVSGARGCAARGALKQQLAARPAAGTAAIRRNLAQAMDRPVEALVPGDMRRFFTESVPLGTYTGLTYSSFLLAKLWEEAEETAAALARSPGTAPEVVRAFERLHLSVGLGCVYAEQVATEGGSRYQLAWLLTGLEEPPFAMTQLHKPRPGALPHGRLVEPQWVAAQLAYLRDLDLMQERMRRQGAAEEGRSKGSGRADREAKPP